jgi:hypothetical protein
VKDGIVHDEAFVLLQKCFRGKDNREIDLMSASLVVVAVDYALVLDECFVAVFFCLRAGGYVQIDAVVLGGVIKRNFGGGIQLSSSYSVELKRVS